MARKKRQIPEQFQTPVQTAGKPKTAYQDDFQSGGNQRVEEFGKQFEGKGKNILYGLAAVAVLAVLIGIFLAWNRRSEAAAQTALGKAIETSQAQVSASPAPAGFTGKMFKTDKERSEAAVAEFQAVADKFGNPTKDKARYFVAVNRLKIDRPVAVQELESLAKTGGEIGTLSKFAVAQAKTGDGKLDEAAALYTELIALPNSVLSKDTLNFELASIYQKQSKRPKPPIFITTLPNPRAKPKDWTANPFRCRRPPAKPKTNSKKSILKKLKRSLNPRPNRRSAECLWVNNLKVL